MDIRRQLATLMPELKAYSRSVARDRSDADDLVGDAVERALTAYVDRSRKKNGTARGN